MVIINIIVFQKCYLNFYLNIYSNIQFYSFLFYYTHMVVPVGLGQEDEDDDEEEVMNVQPVRRRRVRRQPLRSPAAMALISGALQAVAENIDSVSREAVAVAVAEEVEEEEEEEEEGENEEMVTEDDDEEDEDGEEEEGEDEEEES